MLVRAIKEIALKIEILEKDKNQFKSFSSNCFTVRLYKLYSIATTINKSILDMKVLEE